jgi:hypothetical protein
MKLQNSLPPQSDRRFYVAIFGIVLMLIAIVGLAGFFCGCSSWRSGVATGLRAVHLCAGQAEAWAEAHCRPPLEKCKAEGRKTPETCPELAKCQDERRPVLKGIVSARAAVVIGTEAMLAEKVDKGKVVAWLIAAIRAAQALQRALAPWGITLPVPAMPGGA